jgi:uncharacterized protein with von Willebrand factor type A (vWA) domain
VPNEAPQGDRPTRRLVEFGELLRARGVDARTGGVVDALRALEAVGVGSREDAYWAMRCTLTSRQEEIELFNQAFQEFWDFRQEDFLAPEIGSHQDPTAAILRPSAKPMDAAGEGPAASEAEVGASWSPIERLRQRDFAAYDPRESRLARTLIRRLADSGPLRRSRRLDKASTGRVFDQRRTLRSALRTLGPPFARWWRRRKLVPRRVVFLVDVSGSMEPYARAMMMFLQVMIRAGSGVEAFTFGTRLTRVTRHLQGRDLDRALRAASLAVPDWSGGTRIGENLAAFNASWGRRGWIRGAVVVLISDGWERGDVQLLEEAMRRLHRAAHTLVWVNPLAGDLGYQPLARGMATALPFIDVFLPGHNLQSLEALAEALADIWPPRGARRERRARRQVNLRSSPLLSPSV